MSKFEIDIKKRVKESDAYSDLMSDISDEEVKEIDEMLKDYISDLQFVVNLVAKKVANSQADDIIADLDIAIGGTGVKKDA